MSWGIDAVLVALTLVVAPIAAIVLFATGDATSGWIVVAVFVGAILYAALLALELIRRPWTGDDR